MRWYALAAMLGAIGGALLFYDSRPVDNGPCSGLYEWPARWVRDEPCRAPCWEGIVPGQTRADDAVDRILELPFVGRVDAWHNDYANWYRTDGTWGGSLIEVDGRIESVLVGLPKGVRIGDVIKAYGEPSHVAASEFLGRHGDGPFYTLTVIYQPQGFILDTWSLYHDKPDFGLDTCFDLLTFAQSDAALKELDHGVPRLWEGFKDVEAYYDPATTDAPNERSFWSAARCGYSLLLVGILLPLTGLISTVWKRRPGGRKEGNY